MKRIIQTSLTIWIALFAVTVIVAQESDHQIQSSFNQAYAQLETGLNQATSVDQIDSLQKQVLELDENYSEFSALLDNALYPATFSEEMSALAKQTSAAKQRLLIIENQNERLAILGQEVAYYKSEIAFLNTRTDSLRKAIASSQASEERLAQLVRNYRQSLEKRDELVMEVVDSLFITYQGMSAKRAAEISEGVESGRISSTENPLPLISSVLDENIEYASANNAALSVEDHLRMYTVQKHFSEVWEQIGPRMIAVYGGNESGQWDESINRKMKDWRMTTSRNMWNSMDSYLEFSDVDLGAFDNNYSFFVALDNFVKQAQEKGKSEILTSESYEDYKKFQAFWSGKIKNEWSNLVQDAEVLTVAQITTIDEQLSTWESEARPVHPLFLLLLVVACVSVIAYTMTLVKAKKA